MFVKKTDRKLYIDFDGVIVDTITKPYQYFNENNMNSEEVTEYYKNLDWNIFLKESPSVPESIETLNEIVENNIYEVNILTHVTSLNELEEKINFLTSNIKNCQNVNIIGVPKKISKFDMVDPKNNILVDDYSGNLIEWEVHGGIGIKFSNKKNDKFYTINSLRKLITDKAVIKYCENKIKVE
ncbi:MAG: hypothetical protein WDA21_01845 [Bacilli bacterium]